MTRSRKLDDIRQELINMAAEEAKFLWRMARKAKQHGCSRKLVAEIREEADWCHNTAKSYPDRLIYWKRDFNMKYAFKIR